MDNDMVRIEVRRWVRFAREDLGTAEKLLAIPNPVYRHVCWHAQQAAEKALKAALIANRIDFPRTHDLELLLTKLPDSWQPTPLPDLAELTQWAVETRYPGDWPDIDLEDSVRSVEAGGIICSYVETRLADSNREYLSDDL